MEIRQKVVLITGASAGIGAACVGAFRKRGALISLTARSREKLEKLAGSEGLVTAGNLMEPATRERVIQSTLDRFGRIDILINNAGVGMYAPTADAPLADVRELFELNLFTPLATIQLAAPQMRKQHGGMIVNVGSIAGKLTLPWLTLYSASKYALGSLGDGLRIELQRDGVHVMTVCPGYVQTAFQANALGAKPPEAIGRSRRFAITAEECAEAIARGVERNARTIVTPRTGWVFIGLARVFPGIVDAQLRKIYSG
jgi:short-subunit dehydrogenase